MVTKIKRSMVKRGITIIVITTTNMVTPIRKAIIITMKKSKERVMLEISSKTQITRKQNMRRMKLTAKREVFSKKNYQNSKTIAISKN